MLSDGEQINERLVEEALATLLREQGIEPHDGWASVRVVKIYNVPRDYVVVIDYPQAKEALRFELDRLAGESEEGGAPSQYAAGIWVLSPWQARILCERALPDH